jgi:hypothetical protein
LVLSYSLDGPPSRLVLGTTCHIQNQKDWSNCCSRI